MALKKIVENILIDTVRIYGFRSLRDVTVSLGRFTLLTGMNNAGKTSFLRALNLALGVDRRSVDADDFYAGASGGNDGVKQEIVIDVRIIPVDGDGTRTKNFTDEWNNTELGTVVKFEGKEAFVGLRTRASFDEAKNEYALRRYSLKLWRDGVMWHESDEAVESVFTGKVDHLAVFYMNAQRDLVADLRNRASYFGKMLSRVTFGESQEKWEQTLAQMNDEIVKASPELGHLSGEMKNLNQPMGEDGYEVTLTPLTRKLKDLLKGVNVEVQDHGSEAFTLDHHGMGTRSWAALLAYRAYVSWVTKQTKQSEGLPYHPVLALEEPESHLHPNAQRQLCAQMAEMPGQLIVSTHSPYIAALAGLECIRHFTKAKSETSVRQVDVSGLGEEDIRRIRRDVLNTRGELLFARAVVLFEGETEEQALPIFAKQYFGQEPFALGVAMVNVGGYGNYKAFLRLVTGMGIPWLIFSDAETNVKPEVEKQAKGVTGGKIVFLPNGRDFEADLLQSGYQDCIRSAFLELELPPEPHPKHREAKEREAKGKTTAELEQWLDSNKTQAAPKVAEHIVHLSDKTRRIPPKVKELFDELSDVLGVPRKGGA